MIPITWTLGHSRFRDSRAFPGIKVRISDDVRRCVFFLGLEDDTPDSSGIRCVGTGFLMTYELCRYFVTVKHVALPLADAPFLIRLNRTDGTSDNVPIDVGEIRWYAHPDPDVDLAVVPFQYDLRLAGNDVRYIGGIETTPKGPSGFECGDLCYTVGLFRLMAGKKRNLPVVHSGNIALLPSDEKIPVRDWEPPRTGTRYVEGYLVQSESIQGLSGAPVFARTHIELTDMPTSDGKTIAAILPTKDIGFLGVWQGAWDAPADDVRAIAAGKETRVPVGIGVVIPAAKLVEIMEMPELKEQRRLLKQSWEQASAASLDSAVPDALPASDANPTHREDFTRLLGVAARKHGSKD